MGTESTVYFLTFFDREYRKSMERIKREAQQMGFEKIFAWDEAGLGREFWKRHTDIAFDDMIYFLPHCGPERGGVRSDARNICKRILRIVKRALGRPLTNLKSRGFGYWIWKPYLIIRVLQKIPEDACLLYADGGCTLNPQGKARLGEYESLAREGNGIMCLRFGSHTQQMWTKMDTLARIGYGGEKLQCNATVIVFINTRPVRDFVEKWYRLCVEDNYHHLTDSPGRMPNHPSFKEHRHDQAIFSLLAYQHGASMIRDETWWDESVHPGGWEAKKHYPIHARRLKF